MRIFNPVKQRLLAGESVHGLFIKSADPVMAEMLARSGIDFVTCDAEHGAADARELENFARAIECRGGTPFARVASADRATLLRCFDAGCLGVHVPWVEDEATAVQAVNHVKYAPLGRRGLAGTRVSHYGQGVNLVEYMAAANQQTLICAQIESAAGVEQAHRIAAVPGIDVMFLGPTDLSNAIGLPLQFDHPRLLEMIDSVIEAARVHGKVFGIFVRDVSEISHWHAKGARYFISNFETLVFSALKTFKNQAGTLLAQQEKP